MPTHIIALIQGTPGNFGLTFPDVPGCVAAADTMDALLQQAAEALAFHLEGMAEDKQPMPVPHQLESLQANPEFAIDFAEAKLVTLIPYDPPSKAMRVNITIEEHLLEAIDQRARAEGSSRSGFLAQAARMRLGLR